MNKYRKKPVEVEAVQFPEDGVEQHKVAMWVREQGGVIKLYDGNVEQGDFNNGVKYRWSIAFIDTLEGSMAVRVGDYIIRGVKGEFYPCKPEIFEMTYDRVV